MGEMWGILGALLIAVAGLILIAFGVSIGYRSGYWFDDGRTLLFIAGMLAMLVLVFAGWHLSAL